MPSEKDVIALRVTPDEAAFIARVADELSLPKSRVLALGLKLLKERLKLEDVSSDEPSPKSKGNASDTISRLMATK